MNAGERRIRGTGVPEGSEAYDAAGYAPQREVLCALLRRDRPSAAPAARGSAAAAGALADSPAAWCGNSPE